MLENITYENVTNKLLQYVPELMPIYMAEEEDFGEILNYGIFGTSLVRFLAEYCKNDSENLARASNLLNRTLEFIEECATSPHEDIVTLIATGFMEAMYVANYYEKMIVNHMGPVSRELYQSVNSGRINLEGDAK